MKTKANTAEILENPTAKSAQHADSEARLLKLLAELIAAEHVKRHHQALTTDNKKTETS